MPGLPAPALLSPPRCRSGHRGLGCLVVPNEEHCKEEAAARGERGARAGAGAGLWIMGGGSMRAWIHPFMHVWVRPQQMMHAARQPPMPMELLGRVGASLRLHCTACLRCCR